MTFCLDCHEPANLHCESCRGFLCDDCADDGDGLCIGCSITRNRADDDDPEWGIQLPGSGD